MNEQERIEQLAGAVARIAEKTAKGLDSLARGTNAEARNQARGIRRIVRELTAQGSDAPRR